MALASQQTARLGPAPVAVHDDANMTRQAAVVADALFREILVGDRTGNHGELALLAT
jgi:hypothetical protein